MTVYEKLARKTATMAFLTLIAFCLPALFMGDSSAADAESGEVIMLDPVSIELDGEAVDADAFELNGIIYAVTNTTEAEEEVGVYGVSENLPEPGIAIILCSLSYGEGDDEITYSVTGLLSEFSTHCTGVISLVLAESITSFDKDCLKSLNYGTLVVSDSIADVPGLNDLTGYAGAFIKAEDAAKAFSLVFHPGEIEYPEFKNQDDQIQAIPEGIAVSLTPSEEMFTYPYYEFCEWTVDGTEYSLGECDSVACIGGILYVNGEEASLAPADMSVTASWEEEDAYGDYEPWHMWATVGIILVLAVLGLGMAGYRNVMRRRA